MLKKLIPALLALLPALAFAQEVPVQYDTIYTYSGDIVCHVIEDTGRSIIFTYPGETLRNNLPSSAFRFVQLSSGRVIQGAPRTEVRGIRDWKSVVLTSDPREVEGLELAGDFRTRRRSRVEYCEDEIRKAAADRRCHIVLVEPVIPKIDSDLDGDINTYYVLRGRGYRYPGLGEELAAAEADPAVQDGLLTRKGGKVCDSRGKVLGAGELRAVMAPEVYNEYSAAATTWRAGNAMLIGGFAASGLGIAGGIAGAAGGDPGVVAVSTLAFGAGSLAGVAGLVLLISGSSSMDYAISDHNGRKRASLSLGATQSGAGLALRF